MPMSRLPINTLTLWLDQASTRDFTSVTPGAVSHIGDPRWLSMEHFSIDAPRSNERKGADSGRSANGRCSTGDLCQYRVVHGVALGLSSSNTSMNYLTQFRAKALFLLIMDDVPENSSQRPCLLCTLKHSTPITKQNRSHKLGLWRFRHSSLAITTRSILSSKCRYRHGEVYFFLPDTARL